ncbi:hypothetical protein M5689_020829 [Euphorbia peplus]|nr:hypothetical protein M5689_020829 [Euphorbia peplus]
MIVGSEEFTSCVRYFRIYISTRARDSRPVLQNYPRQAAPITTTTAQTAPVVTPNVPIRAPTPRSTIENTRPVAPIANQHTSGPQSSNSSPSSSIPMDFSSEPRLTIWVEDNKICPSSEATKRIRQCFELNLEMKGYKIRFVSQDTLDFYWREFQKRCQWEEVMDASVKSAYSSFMKEAYRRMVYGLKNKDRQKFMTEEVYNSWSTYWESPEAKAESERAQRSRQGGTENGPMSRHTAGSLSMREHRDRLTRLLGRQVTVFELFVYTHTRNHDGLGLTRDHERVTAARERMREATDQVIDEQRVFYDVVGGFNNRSRLYGLGDGSGFYASQAKSINGVPFSTSSSVLRMPQMAEQVTQLEQDMQSLVDDRQADQMRMDGVESRLETVLQLVRDLRSEMELLRTDIASSTGSQRGSPSL